MKNYILRSIDPNEWFESVLVELTTEQKLLLQNRELRESVDFKELQQFISDNRNILVTDIDIIGILNNKFEEIRPDDDFIFIGLNISINENGDKRGILNYRVSDNHQQVRF